MAEKIHIAAEMVKNKNVRPAGSISTGSINAPSTMPFAKKTDTKTSNAPSTMPFAKKTDTKTSRGLYLLASRSGLGEEARRIVKAQAGETSKIFSGGFVSDIFDTLNSLQYGVTGVLKGKTFLEGVKTRQSFSDKDALGEKGLPGVIGGIALDIAVDPLTYIPIFGWGRAAWKGVTSAAKALGKGVSKAPVIGKVAKETGNLLGRKFIYMFGKDPVYIDLYERSIKNIAVSNNSIAKMVNGIIDIPKEKAAQILTRDKSGRMIRKPLEQLKGVLTEKELFNVSKSYAILDDLGKQAVDNGLLSKGKWEENLGEYIKNAYIEYESSKSGGIFGFMKKGVKGIKARKKGLTPEKMAELGQIENPSYLLFKSMFDLVRDVENAKLFKQVANKFGKESFEEGYKQLPKTQRLGELSSKFVPENIFDDIQEITRMPGSIEKQLKKVVAGFKFSKVILNPATHARNVVSNRLLNWWKLGLGPWRVDIDIQVMQDLARARKGLPTKWIREAETVGYNMNTMVSNEITDLLLNGDALSVGSKASRKIKDIAKKLGDIYQGEENYAKLSAFIFGRQKGLGIEESWKMAESATFNYAQVTPFVRRLRESIFGFPFITFAIKAAPIGVETAVVATGRISALGKIKKGIENLSDIKETERERASEPPWIRDGFYIKLPIKDKYGRSAYFDLTYIVPFGDITSGKFFERQIKRDTGTLESVPESMLSKAPLFNLIKEISRNQDFYGNKVWKDSDSIDEQLGDIMRHLTKTYMPPLISDQIPGGYNTKGERQQRGIVGAVQEPAGEGTQKRTLTQELLRQVGAKIQPIDAEIQEMYQEWNTKKGLETLLRENGVFEEFSTMYVPKK
jgi:hypothetical protein